MFIYPLLKYTTITFIFVIILSCGKLFASVNSAKDGIDFNDIKEFANLANAAYRTPVNLNKSNVIENYILTTQGNIPEIEISYFLATNDITKTHHIAVRGTSNIENTIVNISLKLVLDKRTGVYIHKGYLQAAQAIYSDIKPQIKIGYSVNTTGHSLGGAVALILAMYLDSDNIKVGQIITFGQPKVTNIAGAYKFQHLNVIRVVTPKDLIPLLPLIDPMDIKDLDIYWHIGKEIILMPGKNYAVLDGINSMLRATKFTQEPLDENNFINHQMAQYLVMVDKKIPAAELVPFENSYNLFNLFSQ